MSSTDKAERALENIKDKGCRLYDYYLLYPENEIIRDLVESYHPTSYWPSFKQCEQDNAHITEYGHLYACYQWLFDNNHLDIILEMIVDGKSPDELVLCVIFIKNNRKDLLSLLHQRGFNFDQRVFCSGINGECRLDIIFWNLLIFAYRFQGLEMVKYLVELGADVTHFESWVLQKVCENNDHDAIDYLLNFEISEIDLLKIIHAISHMSAKNIESMVIEKILRKGVNLERYETVIHGFIGRYSLEIQKIFINYGLPLASPKLLTQACINHNNDAIEYYLEQGLQPDQEIVEESLFSSNKDILRLFIKHRVDFSKVKSDNDDNLIDDLERLGLDRNTLLNFLLKKVGK